jgi:DNA-binding transcriptional regulator YiaG
MNRSSRGRKPYPWTCGNCRKKAVYEGVTDYEHDLDFEGRTYHIALPGLKSPRCRECGTVLLDSDANEQITLEFFRLAGLLTPEQIRKNREILKLTQKQVASALGVPESTVSGLESGDGQFQDRTLDNLLRLFFGVPKARDLLITGNLNTIGLVANTPAMVST